MIKPVDEFEPTPGVWPEIDRFCRECRATGLVDETMENVHLCASNPLIPKQVELEIKELATQVLGRNSDPRLVRLADIIEDQFDGLDGFGQKLKAVYDCAEPGSPTQLRVIEVALRVFRDVSIYERPVDMSTLSDQQIETALKYRLQQMVYERLRRLEHDPKVIDGETTPAESSPAPDAVLVSG